MYRKYFKIFLRIKKIYLKNANATVCEIPMRAFKIRIDCKLHNPHIVQIIES